MSYSKRRDVLIVDNNAISATAVSVGSGSNVGSRP